MSWEQVSIPMYLPFFKGPGVAAGLSMNKLAELNERYKHSVIPLTVRGQHKGNINNIKIDLNGCVTGTIFEIDPEVHKQMAAKAPVSSSIGEM